MLVVSSLVKAFQRSARAASSASQQNSLLNSGGIDASYASATFDSETDLLPYCSRTASSFGRLMPTGVIGPESPVSISTSIAVADTPRTWGFRYFGSHGMWSSNHCA